MGDISRLKILFGGKIIKILLKGTSGQRLGIYTAKPHLTKTGYSALWNNFVYGTVTAYSIKWLAHPSVFYGEPNAKRQVNIASENDQLYQVPRFEDTEKPIQLH